MDQETLMQLTVTIQEQMEKLKTLDPGSKEHAALSDSIVKLLDQKTRIERSILESENEKEEHSLNVTKAKTAVWDVVLRNVITLVIGAGGLGVTIWGTKRTMKFTETDVMDNVSKAFFNRLMKK